MKSKLRPCVQPEPSARITIRASRRSSAARITSKSRHPGLLRDSSRAKVDTRLRHFACDSKFRQSIAERFSAAKEPAESLNAQEGFQLDQDLGAFGARIDKACNMVVSLQYAPHQIKLIRRRIA